MNFMPLIPSIAYILGGAFFTNGIPHFVSGTMGRAFQSPFAKPPGKGLSSAKVNVVWGFCNFAAAYALIYHVGAFDPRQACDVALVALGVLFMGVAHSHIFGKLHGGASQDL